MTRRTRPRARAVRTTVALVVSISVLTLPSSASAAPPDFTSLLLKHAYARLFTTVGTCPEVSDANSLTGTALTSKLNMLANAYVHVNGQSANFMFLGRDCMGTGTTTFATKLAARGLYVSNYRNGSLVSQSAWNQPLNFGEAADIETDDPLDILTYWPGNWKPNVTGNDAAGVARLTGSISATTTTVKIKASSWAKPFGALDTWPYVNSRGTGLTPGAHSTDTHNFVSWIRVDDELMQVLADPVLSNGVITLTVNRGLWGTAATTHAQNAKVLSPAYVGNKNAAGSDAIYDGTPRRDDVNYPLRYGIKIWTPSAADWIASRIDATIDSDGQFQGYNALWLDVSSCYIYNYADPYGNQIWPWDDPNGTKITVDRWGTYQQTKAANLHALLPGISFFANNFIRRIPGFDAVDACNNRIRGSWDAVDLEHWLNGTPDFVTDWTRAMDQNFDVQTNDVAAMYWVRTDRAYAGDPVKHLRLAYASLLLALRTTATQYQFGSQWGLKRPQQYFYWNWGTPLSDPATIADDALPNGLYRRDFTNAVILVNPTASPITYNLGGTYYDVINKDASGNPSAVTSITVGAQDASFLLRSA